MYGFIGETSQETSQSSDPMKASDIEEASQQPKREISTAAYPID